MSEEKPDLTELFQRFDEMTLSELAAEMAGVRAELDEAKATKSYYQKIHDHLTKIKIPEIMEEQEIDVVKIAGVGRLQVRSDIYCSCPAANREKLQQWLREHGQGALVSETINSSTLKAFIKEAMINGNEYPSDLVKIEPYNQATLTKS